MKTTGLLLSSLNITEDEYDYKGLFILSHCDKSMNVDMADLENETKLDEIKAFFNLDENLPEIRKSLMELVMEKAHISSKICEGENYDENSKRITVETSAKAMDMA